MSLVSKHSLRMFRDIAKRTQINYPETLGSMLIINAPFFFAGVWSSIKGFLDERTRSKVEIVGTNYKKRILEFVENE
jgi:hypothetical protein